MSPCSIILDIETLSREPNSIITEIGLIVFNRSDFTECDFLSLAPNIIDQLAGARRACPETIAFHRSQKTLPLVVGDSTPSEVCHTLRQFISRHQPHRVWIQGPDFDRPILENFCNQFGDSLPWEFWRTRDSRTLWDLAFPGEKHAHRPHHALPDCRATLVDLAKALLALNRTEAA